MLSKMGQHHDPGSANADRGVPTFAGDMKEFREYRKRAEIYQLKQKIMGKSDQEVGLSLMSGLTGTAWDVIEHIDVLAYSPDGDKTFEGENGLVAKIFKELDAAFRYDKKTEMPNSFENFFFKGGRRPRESLLEYFTRVQKLTRSVKEHGIELPDEIQGWLLLRRAGLKKDDRLMIMSRMNDMKIDTVTQALTFTYGQDAVLDHTRPKGSGKGHAYYVEDFSEENDTEPTLDDDFEPFHEVDEEDVHYLYDEDFDADQSYYQTPGDDCFSVDEYDEVYANYVDARKRMNDLRLARGFYPVVALGPDGQSSSVAATPMRTNASTPTPSKGKGKSKPTPKGKSKGKPSSSTAPSAKSRASSMRGDSVCLRCGQKGHWARNCPNNPQGVKRARDRDPDDMVAMVADSVDAHSGEDIANSRMGMLDGGASTMVVGSATLWRYVTHLLQHGVDVRDLDAFQCSKWLRFGNDQSQECTLGAKVPMVCGNRVGVVFCYIIPGETPFLIARPVMETLGLAIDFGDKKIKWPGQHWIDAHQGYTGNYLIDLCDDIEKLQDRRYLHHNAFDLVPDDPSIDFTNIGRLADHGYHFPPVVPAHDDPEAHEDPVLDEKLYSGLSGKQLHDIIHAVEDSLRARQRDLNTGKKIKQGRRKCWEVFFGEGRTSNALAEMGADVRQFGLSNGWNFFRRKDRQAFMTLLHNECPDEIFFSPMCGPWSSIQEMNLLRPDTAAKIMAERDLHHRTILKFTADAYEAQRREGRHAHVEQPKTARSWLTYHYRRMKGYDCDFDQCQYGLSIPNLPGLVKKPTRVRTTKWQMAAGLHARCDCVDPHVELLGNVPGTSQSRTKYAENYPYQLAYRIAELMMEPDVDNIHDDVFPIDDLPPDDVSDLHPDPGVPQGAPPPEPEHDGDHAHDQGEDDEDKAMILRHRQMQLKYGSQVFQYVKKLHLKMGHPSPFILARMLKDAQAPEPVVRCAAEYSCKICLERSQPASPAKTALPIARVFNDFIYMDVMYVDVGQDKHAILSCVDAATRYLLARHLKAETSRDLIKAITRGWIRLFGSMSHIIFDEGTNFCSEEFKQWAESHGVHTHVAPPEAHHRLGPVERRHAVLREALEKYINHAVTEGKRTPNLKLLQEALCFVPNQINTLAYTRGYSSTQWVLGYQPMDITSLSHDRYSPAAQDAIDENDHFQHNLECRSRAAMAFIQADASQRLRRALQRRYRLIKEKPVVGQTVYYWRSQGAGRLQKSRWRGPATVVQIERGADQDRPLCYWLVHGTSLLRCAPEHIRADVGDQGRTIMENLSAAQTELRKVKGRGVTQYIDLRKQRVNPEETDNEMEVDSAPANPDIFGPGPSPAVNEEDFDANWWDDFMDDNGSDAATSAAPTPRATPPPSFSPRTPPEPHPADDVPTPSFSPGTPPEPHPDDAASTSDRAVRPRLGSRNPEPQSEPSGAASSASGQDQVHRDVVDLFDAEPPPSSIIDPGVDVPIPEDDISSPDEDPTPSSSTPFGPMSSTSMTPTIPATPTPATMTPPTISSSPGASASSSTGLTSIPEGGRPSALRRRNRQPAEPYPTASSSQGRGLTLHQNVEDIDMVVDGDNPLPQGWQYSNGAFRMQIDECFVASELSWRTMSARDRAEFIAAKVKELRSFFDNGVWEFTTERESDPARTLRARFLLKWAKDEQGLPRAKARLVIQGFNDPDVLSGDLRTSSPTASRASKMVMLAIAACKRWRPWTADVATAFLQGKTQERKLYVKLPAEALRLLGATADTRMLLNKPCYGQADAPRRWWMEADSRLQSIGLRPHRLDPCLYLSFNSKNKLDGLVVLHVDDMLGAGDELTDDNPSWRRRIAQLKSTFNFREWQNGQDLEYCGAEITVHNIETDGFSLRHSKYAKKLKPITIDKHRINKVTEPVNATELKQLRGLLCSLQWPATQSCPHLQATVSLLMGEMAKGTVQTALNANKALRFFKSNSDVGIDFVPVISDLDDAAFITMTDAAWGVRADGSSQSGYLIFLAHKSVLHDQVGRYVLLDWKSCRTPRMSRSSLNSEAQAAATGVDAMEHILATWALCRYPDLDPREDSTLRAAGTSSLVVDAKSLYDSLLREHINSVTDKRTGIELMVIKERIQAMGATVRWQSSERQYADGMTKIAARQLLADRLRCGEMLLIHDEQFVAAKKKPAEERVANSRAHATSRKKSSSSTTS